MNPTNQVLKIYTDLRKVKDEMKNYQRQFPNGVFAKLFKNQTEKIEWCYKDAVTTPILKEKTEALVDAIKESWTQEYTLERDALKERLELLSLEQLKQFDTLMDYIEQGKAFEVKFIDE